MGHSSPKNAENENGSGMDWIPGQARNDVGWELAVVVSGFQGKPGMTCKTLVGRAEHTSSRTSPSSRGDIDPGSMTGKGLDSGSSPE